MPALANRLRARDSSNRGIRPRAGSAGFGYERERFSVDRERATRRRRARDSDTIFGRHPAARRFRFGFKRERFSVAARTSHDLAKVDNKAENVEPLRAFASARARDFGRASERATLSARVIEGMY